MDILHESRGTRFSRNLARLLGQDKGLTLSASLHDWGRYSYLARVTEHLFDLVWVILGIEARHCERSWWRETLRAWLFTVGERNNSALSDLLLPEYFVSTTNDTYTYQRREALND